MRKFNTIAIVALTAAFAFAALPAEAMNLPNRGQSTHESSDSNCGEGLLTMKRVIPDELANVTKKRDVWVTEVCYGQDLGISPNEGNVAAIRTALADNDVIVEKLWDRGFTDGDVIAVQMIDDDVVQLFVAH